MIPPASKVTRADVKLGIRVAWRSRRGALLASGILAVALTVIAVLGGSPLWLALVLITVELVNIGRLLYLDVVGVRDLRDYDAYLTQLNHTVAWHEPADIDWDAWVEEQDHRNIDPIDVS